MVTLAGLRLGRVDPDPIIPDYRNGEDEGVDSVKDSAMPGEQTPGILDPRASLVRRFEQIANLPRHVPNRSHPQQVCQGSVDPANKEDSDEQRAKETRDTAFPRFLGTEMRRKGMPSDRSAYEIRRRVAHPGDDQ